MKPKVLLINCYSDNHRGAKGNPNFIPQSMATVALAGQFHADKVALQLYCEFARGPFEDLKSLAWADLLVLTGLNPAFDRMKQITAYARTVNPGIAVAMGGSLARALPLLSQRYFDYVCQGDLEDIGAVIDDVFGPGYRAEQPFPRFDLARWPPWFGFAESSRNCNFRCDFCSMTAEGRRYFSYGADALPMQVEAMGYKACLMVLDQNFYGGGRRQFTEKVGRLEQLYRAKKIGSWSALATADLYADPANLVLAKQSGCTGFFCGIESFSRAQIAAFKKKQNLLLPQEDVIRRSLDAGLMLHYGMVFDTTERTVADIREEIDFIVGNPNLTLPSFLSIAIPMLGSPLFQRRLDQGALLPHLKLRDMDGCSIICQSRDSDAVTADFARKMHRGGLVSRRQLLRHALLFYARHGRKLSPIGMASAATTYWALSFPGLGTNGRDRNLKYSARTYFANTEALGTLYTPQIPMAEKMRDHFAPLILTNDRGELHPSVQADLQPKAVQLTPSTKEKPDLECSYPNWHA